MDANEAKVGSLVRFVSSRRLAQVVEIDREFHATRVRLMDDVGAECWAATDDLEVVVWEKLINRNVGAE